MQPQQLREVAVTSKRTLQVLEMFFTDQIISYHQILDDILDIG